MDMLEIFQQELIKRMNESMGIPTSMLGASTSTTATTASLTMDSIKQSLELVLPHKIEIRTSEYIGKNNATVIDHEKIRESFPLHKERGKTIICHPDDEDIIRKQIFKG